MGGDRDTIIPVIWGPVLGPRRLNDPHAASFPTVDLVSVASLHPNMIPRPSPDGFCATVLVLSGRPLLAETRGTCQGAGSLCFQLSLPCRLPSWSSFLCQVLLIISWGVFSCPRCLSRPKLLTEPQLSGTRYYKNLSLCWRSYSWLPAHF